MAVWNEYDNLKTVLLGKRFESEIVESAFDYLSPKEIDNLITINEETNEDLDDIQKFLESEGVKVYRPDTSKYWDLNEKYNFKKLGNICDPGAVRDWCFSYGDLILITQLSFSQRQFEFIFWEDAFHELEQQGKILLKLYHEDVLEVSGHWNKHQSYTPKELKQKFKEKLEEYQLDDSYNIPRNQNFTSKVNKMLSLSDDEILHLMKKGNLLWTYVYFLTNFSNKILTHSASYFKHNNNIIGTPLGTLAGRRNFEKTVKAIYPNTVFHYDTLRTGHIDGTSNILDKHLRVSFNEDDGYGIKGDYVGIDDKFPYKDIETIFLSKSEDFEDTSTISSYSKRFDDYLQNMRGYEQRVDFDLNGLTYSPRKMVGGFFSEERYNKLSSFGIHVENIPMRHRNKIDGGIHCYTLDVDRDESN